MKILTISDPPIAPTGFGNQIGFLNKFFVEQGHDVTQIAIFWTSGRMTIPVGKKSYNVFPVRILPNLGMDVGGKITVMEERERNPDYELIVSLCEDWTTKYLMTGKRGRTWIQMIPVDNVHWHELPKEGMQHIDYIDYIVVPSQWGHSYMNAIGIKNYYIPHCVDPVVFHPLKRKKMVELIVQKGIQNKFIVLWAARPGPRKNPIEAMKIFQKFLKDKDDAMVWMHTDPIDPSAEFDIIKMAEKLGFKKKLIMSKDYVCNRGLPQSQLNEVYNLADVQLMTGNEGFGVPLIEGMATGLPVVGMEYTTGNEFIGKDERGFIYESAGERKVPPPSQLKNALAIPRPFPDVDKAVEALEKMYALPESHNIRLRQRCRNFARLNYNPQKVSDMWKDLLSRIHPQIATVKGL